MLSRMRRRISSARITSDALAATRLTLNAIQASTDAFPPLKSSVSVVLVIMELSQRAKLNKKGCEHIAKRSAQLEVERSVVDIENLFKEIESFFGGIETEKAWKRFVRQDVHKSQVAEYGRLLDEAMMQFSFNLELSIPRLHMESAAADEKRHAAVLTVSQMSESERLVLANSGRIGGPASAVGRYLCEQSVAFCQILLKNEIVPKIRETKDYETTLDTSKFTVNAFSYGDVGPRADPRVVVDLRFFGKQDINKNNFVDFGTPGYAEWSAGVTDIYGMPQPTVILEFEVRRSLADRARDHRSAAVFIHSAFLGHYMTVVVNALGAFLPGSQPQFMDDADKQEPGLAVHITGTTNPEESVADHSSCVHGFTNLWVGGNGCIPDSTVCNPTITSVTIALKGAEAAIQHLRNTAN
ncbi:hypothetical protein B0H14DRAFT_3867807 [Mycena olivaceomarginata]|nr:hypothetical protein B0H14DRAFT_3867807 [Mycena olivaceomarginata]